MHKPLLLEVQTTTEYGCKRLVVWYTNHYCFDSEALLL